MKRRFLATIALVLVLSMALSGCAAIDFVKDFFQKTFGEEIELTDAPLNAERVIDFANGADKSVFFESNGWTNGDVFNVVWTPENVKYADGVMKLGITEEKATAWLDGAEVEYNYTAGEARSQNYYHYGDYVVSMKPSANPGTASTFFICTGPYDEKIVDGVKIPNPHDEIDIEFLGKDTTKVQFNFFVNGTGGNEFMFDLGFDASEEFHEYGFRWEETAITWFVDGKPVYKVTTDKTATEGKNVRIVEALPQTAGRMLGNYWCGNERAWGWMGAYKGNVNDDGCQYQWIATSAVGAPLNPPTDDPATPPAGNDTINWADIAPITPNFDSNDVYTVVNEGNTSTITYTKVGGQSYRQVFMDISSIAAGKNYIQLTVTNNADTSAEIRVNLNKGDWNAGTLQNLNISATQDGAGVRTDTVNGGSFFVIEGKATAVLVINFAPGAEALELMLDSSTANSDNHAGNLTFADIKFATVGEVEVPCTHVDENADGKCDSCGADMPAPPVQDPVSGNLNLSIGDYTTTIEGNVADGYGINVGEDGKIRVTYTKIGGGSYKNFWANVASIAGSKNIFSMKVTNNGTETVKLRIDIESQTPLNEYNTACNVSSTMNGESTFTDTTWGGSFFEIPAGETVAIEVVYAAAKLPTNVKFMVDSSTDGSKDVFAGDITLSDLAFSGEYTPDQGGDDNNNPDQGGDDNNDPDQGETPVTPPVDTGLQFNFWISNGGPYIVNGNNIKYNGAGNTYACVGTDIAALAAGKNTFTVTVTNNGTADSRVRFDIQATVKVGNTNSCNVSATGGDVYTNPEWNESSLTVPAGQSVTVVITYDGASERGAVTNLVVFVDAARGNAETYDSDITLSGMAFSNVVSEEPKPEENQPVVGESLSFNADAIYTLSATKDEKVDSIQVTYTQASNNTWQNVNTNILDKSAGKTNVCVTVRNNGTETVKISVKVEAQGQVELAMVKESVNPGETKTISVDFAGDAKLLVFFIDTDWEQVPTTHAGDITISGINFK